jgi:hypothetical protein
VQHRVPFACASSCQRGSELEVRISSSYPCHPFCHLHYPTIDFDPKQKIILIKMKILCNSMILMISWCWGEVLDLHYYTHHDLIEFLVDLTAAYSKFI